MRSFIFPILIALTFVLIVTATLMRTYAGDVVGSGSELLSTSAQISNATPSVDTIRISNVPYGSDSFFAGILPNVGTDRTVHINGVVSDLNDATQIQNVSVTFYRSGAYYSDTDAGIGCVTDNNDCYRNVSCTLDVGYGTAIEAAYNCPVALAYWVDSTADGGHYADQNWRAFVTVTDTASASSSLMSTVEVNSLLALDIPSSINYGSRVLNEQTTATTNQEMIFTQRGNTRADLELSGTSMACATFGAIPLGNQRWSLTDVAYSAGGTQALTGTSTLAGRGVAFRESESIELTASLFWNIGIPASGVKGSCAGTNTVVVFGLTSGRTKEWRTDTTAHTGALTENGWIDTGDTLPGELVNAELEIIGDYVYLFGGNSPNNNVIYRAPVTNPTQWVDTGATLPNPLRLAESAIIGDYVYLFGGCLPTSCGPNITDVIYRAPLSNPLAWVDTGSTLPVPASHTQLFVVDDYVYLLPGYHGVTGVLNTHIFRAPVSNPLAWVDMGPALPEGAYSNALAIIGNYVYSFGGISATSSSFVIGDAIYRAPLSNPLAWVDTGSVLPTTISRSQLAIIGDYVYLLGGCVSGNCDIDTKTIYRAPLSDPLTWIDTGNELPADLMESSVAVIGDSAYLFGGFIDFGQTDRIFKAPIVP